jgi:hypothetical protein
MEYIGRRCLFIAILNECLRLPNEGNPHPLKSSHHGRHCVIPPLYSFLNFRCVRDLFSVFLLSDSFPNSVFVISPFLLSHFLFATCYSFATSLLLFLFFFLLSSYCFKNAENEDGSDPMGVVSRKCKNSVKYFAGGY